MKSYTNIEQSRKLAKILPPESADMIYKYDFNEHCHNTIPEIPKVTIWDDPTVKDLPAWSLAALLNIIPKHIKEYNVLRINIGENDTDIWYYEIGYGVNNNLPDITMEYAVDACVAMIEKLHKLNLL